MTETTHTTTSTAAFVFARALTIRRIWTALALVCVGMLAFGLYLQHVVGLNPCPMCIVQRYALLLVAVWAILGGLGADRVWMRRITPVLVLTTAGFGAFVAARQSWLQWYPPEVQSCGRDLYGMIESFPLQRAIPMIFRGSGDCTAIDWTFLGGSIANWSFMVFMGLSVVAAYLAIHAWRGSASPEDAQASRP